MRITIDDILHNKHGILKLVDKFGMDIPNDIEGREFSKLFNKWKSREGYETNYYFAEALRNGLNKYLSCNNDSSVNEIKIGRKDIMSMVSECTRRLLNEDQTAKSISAAIKLLMDEWEMGHDDADWYIRKTIRANSPILRTHDGGKFILGVTRLYIDGVGPERINDLNTVLKTIVSGGHINEFDRNLNGLPLRKLLWMFKDEIKNNIDSDRADLESLEHNGRSRYKIVRIDSFDDAEAYSEFTSWCITHDESMFDSYTQEGINQFYFCLRNDFTDYEGLYDNPGENAPLDDYGLSMLAVCVDENGALLTCTCRWNHDNGGNDTILNTREISQLIGQNFYSVFKPNSKWEDELEKARHALKTGGNLDNIFDYVAFSKDGAKRVKLNGRFNFIVNGDFLSDVWFDWASDFDNGYAIVRNKYGCNLIDVNGNYLFKEWYDIITRFDENGLAMVKDNDKWNIITRDEKVLCKEWFDDLADFHEGIARVGIRKRGYNIIDINGNILSNTWYRYMSSEMSNGLILVIDENNRYNYLDKQGNIRFNTWFFYATDFMNGAAMVKTSLDKDFSHTFVIDTNGYISRQDGEIKGKIE